MRTIGSYRGHHEQSKGHGHANSKDSKARDLDGTVMVVASRDRSLEVSLRRDDVHASSDEVVNHITLHDGWSCKDLTRETVKRSGNLDE